MLGRDEEYNRSYLLRALWAFLAVGLSLLVSGIVIAST